MNCNCNCNGFVVFDCFLDKGEHSGAGGAAVKHLAFGLVLAKDDAALCVVGGVAAVYAYAAERGDGEKFGQVCAELGAVCPCHSVCSGGDGGVCADFERLEGGKRHVLCKMAVAVLQGVAHVDAVDA